MTVDNLIIHEKPVTMFSYLSGEKRLIPDQCMKCHHLIKQYDGKKGLYCSNHVSIVDKDTFIQNIFRVYHLDENNPYKQLQEKCELIDREPQHVIYADTFAGQKTTTKGDGEMLKDQRDRFPGFLKSIQLIIDKESLNVVEKLLNTKGPTIKGWFKGKSNGGTEPISSDYSLYEERVRSYIAKFENENKIVKQESAKDSYLGSIRKVNEFSGYFLSLHPTIEMPKMKELHEGTSRLLSNPDEYEDWNVAASMRSSG
ncbi:MAG: hypothetical protein JWM44_2086 [Bacilli bacterium]|nr:hypothetical protein [Bacilli bacterium]